MTDHAIRTQKVPGTPYTVHQIVLADGRLVHQQLSPYDAHEIGERIAAFLQQAPAVESKPLPFVSQAGRPGRPKKGEGPRTYNQYIEPDES